MSFKNTALVNTTMRRRYFPPTYKSLTALFIGVAIWSWLHLGRYQRVLPLESFEPSNDHNLHDILNSTLGFQQIFVLNLPSRTDRRDAISLAAAVSGIQFKFIHGVKGEDIEDRAFPPPEENLKLPSGIKGSWRTHINALQRVVEQNLTTAFILEDDVDWDVRVRENLRRFALASRILSEVTKDPTLADQWQERMEQYPNTETKQTAFRILTIKNIPTTLFSLPLQTALSSTKPSQHHALTSPYGDPSQWDILWLGHCGAGMPRPSHSISSQDPSSYDRTSNLILTHSNDPTVPSPRYLKAHPFQGEPDALATAFPPHTRIYHRSTGGQLCTVGYAVSQRGARRLLHQFGVKGWNGIFDAELGRWCAGYDPDMGEQYPKSDGRGVGGGGAKERVCLTTQPPIFAHHHPMKGTSDIGGLGGGYARKYETKYLRYSVRMNLEALVEGAGEDSFVDQWPDDTNDNI